ncbi:MAG: (d)CMP kinase [Aquificota bacterium]|nr:MAG: (d)CMP kinase [Aquificota bacterium]
MKIAIDGPAGSGKSTAAREVSRRLGIPYLNTGLVYRAFAYVCLMRGIEPERALEVFEEPVSVELLPGETKVHYRGEDIGGMLVSEEVGNMASRIGALPAFRERINMFFRSLVGRGQVVAEGRDAGTHIFPDADLKVFLTASAEERARRRYEQLRAQGQDVSYEEILRAVVERDERDANRPLYPFRPAEDAGVIDTTGLSPQEGVEKIMELLSSTAHGCQKE